MLKILMCWPLVKNRNATLVATNRLLNRLCNEFIKLNEEQRLEKP
jgi:hypothetical protein